MATSGSTDFGLTATEVVAAARRKIGIHAAEEPLQAVELEEGLQEANLMFKDWATDGVQAWTYTEGTLTLVDGTASYLFGSGGTFTTVPFDVLDVRITRDGRDMPMLEMSREEYYALPNKTTTGYPTQWFYDRQRASGTMYVWPVPDSGAGTLGFTYKRKIEDLDAAANETDLPVEWQNAIVYGLADRLAENYGIDAPKITAKAMLALSKVKSFDGAEGKGSVSIMPTSLDRY